jgi:hypothetical protein
MRGVKQCYMCDAPATSKEHVPPKCIFPERKDSDGQYLREGLITVPSCELHNSKKSADDEFLMVSIAGLFSNNSIGYQHKMTKVFRAIKKGSNRLLDKAFLGRKHFIVPIKDNKFIEVIRGTPDFKRLEKCFEQIALGLFFHHFKIKFKGVNVLMTHFEMKDKNGETYIEFVKQRAELELRDKERFGKNPAVFFHQFTNPDPSGMFIVKMCFYEGCIILVRFAPKGTIPQTNLGLLCLEGGIKTFIELEGKKYEFN